MHYKINKILCSICGRQKLQDKNITEKRDRYLGGSDLPKVMTTSNLYRLAHEKLNPKFHGNEYTFYGQFIEPKIRQYINYSQGYEFAPATIIRGEYRGNCDGIDDRFGKLLEIKTYGADLDLNYYLPQIQCYLELFDLKNCIVAAYQRPDNFFHWGDITSPQSYNLEFNTDRIEMYLVQRNKATWRKIDRRASNFMRGLNALRTNPALKERDFNIQVYGKRFVELTEAWRDSKELQDLCVREDIYKAQIGGVHIARTDISELVIDVGRLAEEMPEVFEKYKNIKNSKKFAIRRNKYVITE